MKLTNNIAILGGLISFSAFSYDNAVPFDLVKLDLGNYQLELHKAIQESGYPKMVGDTMYLVNPKLMDSNILDWNKFSNRERLLASNWIVSKFYDDAKGAQKQSQTVGMYQCITALSFGYQNISRLGHSISNEGNRISDMAKLCHSFSIMPSTDYR